MKLGLKDNVKRCCIIAKEVSFCFVLMFRARLIPLKSLILLHVFLPHLIFRFHVKTFEINLVKNAQYSAPRIYHDNQEMDGFQSNCSDLQVSLILCTCSDTISWCQWVLVGGENDCHLCRYVSCTFLHLTADCDGWEKTDPGDSLDAEEGEGCRHVYLCVTLRSWTNDSLNIQMNLS